MVKRKSNVFGSSSDSESDSEYHKIENAKRKKKPPIFGEIKNNDIDKRGCENEHDEEDYMEYPTEDLPNDDKEGKYDSNSNRFEGMKYDEVQKIKREEALNLSLFTNKHANKSIGLSIMQKMGFKIGDSLGNSGKDKTIITNPIDVLVKTNRLGIGASNSTEKGQLGPQTEMDVLEYRDRIQKSKTNSKNEFMINKAMKLCFELSGDSEEYYKDKEIFKPQEVNILWRPYVIDMIEKDHANKFHRKVIRIDENTGSGSESETYTSKEIPDKDYELYKLSEPLDKLERLLTYMRLSHNYCFYCGCSFKDQEDLAKGCPGIHEEDHFDL